MTTPVVILRMLSVNIIMVFSRERVNLSALFYPISIRDGNENQQYYLENRPLQRFGDENDTVPQVLDTTTHKTEFNTYDNMAEETHTPELKYNHNPNIPIAEYELERNLNDITPMVKYDSNSHRTEFTSAAAYDTETGYNAEKHIIDYNSEAPYKVNLHVAEFEPVEHHNHNKLMATHHLQNNQREIVPVTEHDLEVLRYNNAAKYHPKLHINDATQIYKLVTEYYTEVKKTDNIPMVKNDLQEPVAEYDPEAHINDIMPVKAQVYHSDNMVASKFHPQVHHVQGTTPKSEYEIEADLNFITPAVDKYNAKMQFNDVTLVTKYEPEPRYNDNSTYDSELRRFDNKPMAEYVEDVVQKYKVLGNNINYINNTILTKYYSEDNLIDITPVTKYGSGENGMEIISLAEHKLEKRPKDLILMTKHDQQAHIMDNRSVADALAKRIKVLCWIMTCPKNHMEKAVHVKETWGKRCDILLFMSTKYDPILPTIKLPVQEGRLHLWMKTREAFRYVYEQHLYDVEWFLKADDDTYVVVENLRHMLNEYNTNDPIYFGHRFKMPTLVKQGYMSGGAGYVLSREALIRFVTKALPSPELCSAEGSVEDLGIGICLENVGVMAMDTRDPYQRGRFFPFVPHDHVNAEVYDFWYWNMIYYPIETGRNCCSEYAISFHYMEPRLMYVMEYFIYHLRVYGITYSFNDNIYTN